MQLLINKYGFQEHLPELVRSMITSSLPNGSQNLASSKTPDGIVTSSMRQPSFSQITVSTTSASLSPKAGPSEQPVQNRTETKTLMAPRHTATTKKMYTTLPG